MRFQITSVHGEYATVYHVIDTEASDAEQPAIVESFSTAVYGVQAWHRALDWMHLSNGPSD